MALRLSLSPLCPSSSRQAASVPGGWPFAWTAPGWQMGFYLIAKLDVLDVKGDALEYAFSPDTASLGRSRQADTERQANRDVRAVAWSPNSRFLYAGGSLRSKEVRQIRKWADGGRGQSVDLSTGSLNNIFQIIPTRSGGSVYGTRDGSFGAINDRGERTIFVIPPIPNYQANHEGFRLRKCRKHHFTYRTMESHLPSFQSTNRSSQTHCPCSWATLKAAFTFQPVTEGLRDQLARLRIPETQR